MRPALTVFRLTALSFASLFSASSLPATAKEPIDIGNRRELFVDEHLIAQSSGDVRQEVILPEPRDVVFVTDEPWEGNTSGYYTFFQDGDLYRMIYRGWQHAPDKKPEHPEVTCYAESRDGIHWHKPSLGIYAWQGSQNNNIIWTGPEAHNFTPFLDGNPAAPADARFKALGGGSAGLMAFASPDCQRWERLQPAPVITHGAFDSQNLAFWDAHRSEYRAYWRHFADGVRAIRTATSQDFVTWENEADLVYREGTPTEHLYTNAIQPYFRAPHLLLGFPTRYEPKSQQVEPIFMSSRDGVHFHRFSEAVVPRTAPQDRNHNRSNYMAWGILQLPGATEEISVYATENYYEPSPGRIRRFVYRIDGFVALRGGPAGGEVLSKPLRYLGEQLQMNYVVRDGGELRVEVLDQQGERLGRSVALQDDAVDATIRWEQPPHLSDGVVQLRWILRDADVYSFRFHP